MFDINDHVKIKDNFFDYRFDDDPGLDEEMKRYAGKEFVVERIYQSNERYKVTWYDLEDNVFTWDERWLEPVIATTFNPVTENEIMSLFGE